MGMI
jgi:hypothetical protein